MADQQVPSKRRRRFSGKRVAVVRRLLRTADAQVFQIEQRLFDDRQQPDESERDARTLAVLARTLRDLAALDEAKPDAAKGSAAAHDESAPRDVDELRRSLAQKLEALVAGRAGDVRGEPD